MNRQFKHKPLKEGLNKLRTAGLASVKSAQFGMVRNGGTRAHQGIDIRTDGTGWRCYAVNDGKVVLVAESPSGYGKQVCIDIGGGLFAFYAHLSRIDVKQGDLVVAGQQIGLSGDTGNAKGMDTLSKGAHLHFEVRTKAFAGAVLGNRLNPLDYFDLD